MCLLSVTFGCSRTILFYLHIFVYRDTRHESFKLSFSTDARLICFIGFKVFLVHLRSSDIEWGKLVINILYKKFKFSKNADRTTRFYSDQFFPKLTNVIAFPALLLHLLSWPSACLSPALATCVNQIVISLSTLKTTNWSVKVNEPVLLFLSLSSVCLTDVLSSHISTINIFISPTHFSLYLSASSSPS